MKFFDCIQGSEEWTRLRMGKPTASEFGRIVTPAGKLSTASEVYMQAIIAEVLLDRPLGGVTMPWMERGHDLEEEAASYYELEKEVDTERIGFVTNDAETIGASPDRLVGADGLLEIKCPSPQVHVGYLLFSAVDKTYWPQIQGQLLVTEREWLDIVSYHPGMPNVIVRANRDEKYIKLLDIALTLFVDRLHDAIEQLRERGYVTDAGPLRVEQA